MYKLSYTWLFAIYLVKRVTGRDRLRIFLLLFWLKANDIDRIRFFLLLFWFKEQWLQKVFVSF